MKLSVTTRIRESPVEVAAGRQVSSTNGEKKFNIVRSSRIESGWIANGKTNTGVWINFSLREWYWGYSGCGAVYRNAIFHRLVERRGLWRGSPRSESREWETDINRWTLSKKFFVSAGSPCRYVRLSINACFDEFSPPRHTRFCREKLQTSAPND